MLLLTVSTRCYLQAFGYSLLLSFSLAGWVMPAGCSLLSVLYRLAVSVALAKPLERPYKWYALA